MQKNENGKNRGFAVSAARGAAVGIAVILILFAVFALFISSGKLPVGAMKPVTLICAFIGALAGSVVAVRRHGARVLLVGTTVGAAIFFLTLIGSAFSETGGVLRGLTPGLFAALISGGVLGSLLSLGKKKRKRA